VPSVRPAARARLHLFQHRHAGSAAAQRSMPAGGERACGARVDLARAVQHREDAQHGALRAGQVRERKLHLPAAQRAPGCLSTAEGSGGLRRHLTGADRRRGGQRTSDLSRHTGSVRRWSSAAGVRSRGRAGAHRKPPARSRRNPAQHANFMSTQTGKLGGAACVKTRAEQSRGTLSTSPRLAWFQATSSPPNQKASAYTCMREVREVPRKAQRDRPMLTVAAIGVHCSNSAGAGCRSMQNIHPQAIHRIRGRGREAGARAGRAP